MFRTIDTIRRAKSIITTKQVSLSSPNRPLHSRHISNTPSLNMTTQNVPQEVQNFLDQTKIRRSTYTLSKETTISDEGVQSIIEQALDEVPSTFGSYTTRIVLATANQHDKFWDLTTDIVKAVTPDEQWEAVTKQRLAGFKGGYGTILFFEDPEKTRELSEKFAFAKDKFPIWADQTNAMHQFVIWTALNVGGNGANLQHYNPLVDEQTKKLFNIPEDWRLIAQMVYGKPTSPAGPKPIGSRKPMSERLLVPGEQ